MGAEHRKGYCDTILCEECFTLAGRSALPTLDVNEAGIASRYNNPSELYSFYKADVADYCHKYYMTRKYVESTKFSVIGASIKAEKKDKNVNSKLQFLKQKNRNDRNYSNMLLSSYAPTDNQIFSLIFFTTFYDIPGRVPRWATHSGSDYHGTWIPQIVRISLLRYTKPAERVLCNFSGRGTDPIECFLLQRKAVAVDINQSSVFLAQRNVSFALSLEAKTSAAFRPLIIKGDSRDLKGYLFLDESFDHILSHPPYKDCLSYSNNLEGDLSQISDEIEFQAAMLKVARESKRLLKPFRRLTLVTGDNRKDCYYQVVGFDTIKTYLSVGFEIEDLIIKRQRHCRAAPLGAFLCKNYDFLMMTHELVVILRKLPAEAESVYTSILNIGDIDNFAIKCNDERCGFNSAAKCSWHNYLNPKRKSTLRMIPNFVVSRTAVSMGTTWVVSSNEEYSLSQLIVSKIVERYGRNDAYWEEIRYPDLFDRIISEVQYIDNCREKHERNVDTSFGLDANNDEKLTRMKSDSDMLFHLGLKLDLSCEGEDDSRHYRHMMSDRFFVSEDACHPHQPSLIVIPNMDLPPCAITSGCWLSLYRREIISCVGYSINRVCEDGVVAVGVKDVRVASDPVKYAERRVFHKTHLVPLSLIVADDLKKFVPEIRDEKFRLKDFISAVSSGYQCRKEDNEISKMKFLSDVEEWKDEIEDECRAFEDPNYVIKGRRSFPIVHAVYLIYTRNRSFTATT